MYLEMKQAGLPEPEYRTEAFMVYATIKNKKFVECRQETIKEFIQDNTQDNISIKILQYCKEPRSKSEITIFLGYKDARGVARNHIKPLLQAGKLEMTIPDKPNSKNQKYVAK